MLDARGLQDLYNTLHNDSVIDFTKRAQKQSRKPSLSQSRILDATFATVVINSKFLKVY